MSLRCSLKHSRNFNIYTKNFGAIHRIVNCRSPQDVWRMLGVHLDQYQSASEYLAEIYKIPIHLNKSFRKFYINMKKSKATEYLKEHCSDIKYHKQSTTSFKFYINNIGP